MAEFQVPNFVRNVVAQGRVNAVHVQDHFDLNFGVFVFKSVAVIFTALHFTESA